MCGILGFINYELNTDQFNLAKKFLDHRGPDDNDSFKFRNDKFSLIFFHNRLSILDLNYGGQPMVSSDENYCVVFNGEIYNFKLLRSELVALGYKFKTSHSDTEILIHGYKEWGKKISMKLNGMWSFAIFDKKKQEIFLSRDRFGEKPLYYYLKDKKFIFASELSAISQLNSFDKKINFSNLKKYCAYGYFPFDLTPYENVKKLNPGSNMLLKLDTFDLKIEKYWEYKLTPDYNLNERQWSEKIYELLNKSVKDRLVADVQVGVFLSGGLDSSIIALLASKHKKEKIDTFSINFAENSFDESKYSNYVSKRIGSKHNAKMIDMQNFENLCSEFLLRSDEPLSDSSLISYYLLCKHSSTKVKVALGGDASDEVFGGYDTFNAIKYADIYSKFNLHHFRSIFNFLVSFVPTQYSNMNFKFKTDRFLRFSGNLGLAHCQWLSPLNFKEISEIFGEETTEEELFSESLDLWNNNHNSNLIDKSLEFYAKTFLQGQILVKVDRLSMMHGLEVRSPFLDYDLIDCVQKIPSNFKIKNSITKYILKRTFDKDLTKFITDRKKMGFSAPISNWLMNSKIYSNLSSNYLRNKQNFFSKKLTEHRSLKKENRILLWNLINLDNFLKKNNN
tara:strand:+ start:27800 stop:29659 length:1860 start_codon:yes stop_codon:yes gene_type:complete